MMVAGMIGIAVITVVVMLFMLRFVRLVFLMDPVGYATRGGGCAADQQGLLGGGHIVHGAPGQAGRDDHYADGMFD